MSTRRYPARIAGLETCGLAPTALQTAWRWAYARQPTEWEDLLHEGLLRLLARQDAMQLPPSFQVTIMIRGMVDALRKRYGDSRRPWGRYGATEIPYDDDEYPASEAGGLGQLEMYLDLQRLLAPRDARTQHLLWAWATGVDLADIARAEGKSLALISMWMKRVLPGWRAVQYPERRIVRGERRRARDAKGRWQEPPS